MTDNPGSLNYVPNIIVPDTKGVPRGTGVLIIQADIANAINQGYSVEQTIRGYREAGLAFTDSKVRDLYHNTAGEIFAAVNGDVPTTRNLTPDSEIDDMSRQVASWKTNDRYADVIQLSVYDINSGDTRNILFRYYHSDEAITVQDLIDRAMESFNEPPEGQAQYLEAFAGSLFESFRSSDFI